MSRFFRISLLLFIIFLLFFWILIFCFPLCHNTFSIQREAPGDERRSILLTLWSADSTAVITVSPTRIRANTSLSFILPRPGSVSLFYKQVRRHMRAKCSPSSHVSLHILPSSRSYSAHSTTTTYSSPSLHLTTYYH